MRFIFNIDYLNYEKGRIRKMNKVITADIKEAVYKSTETALQETKEVNLTKIMEILESEYKIRFFNTEALYKLVEEALNQIVYIRL